jgi:hypothetical protein
MSIAIKIAIAKFTLFIKYCDRFLIGVPYEYKLDVLCFFVREDFGVSGACFIFCSGGSGAVGSEVGVPGDPIISKSLSLSLDMFDELLDKAKEK